MRVVGNFYSTLTRRSLDAVNETCKNPDDACDRTAIGYWNAIPMCTRCLNRFRRHGDGKRLRPWGAYLRKHGGRR